MFSKPETIEKLSSAIAGLQREPPLENALPSADALSHARSKLVQRLPSSGTGLEETIRHLTEELAPAFNGSSRSSNYYGFVTGGSTAAATLADNLVTLYDQNVQVHLPNETIATEVEDRALSLTCELLDLDPADWPHRIFTTGATTSNVLGLACGREYILEEAAAPRDISNSTGEFGIFQAMRRAGIDEVRILTTVPHSSLSKAAGILGMGRAAVKIIGQENAPHKFDMKRLKELLSEPRTASIVAISASEVNTGLFATSGLEEMKEIRQLCDVHGAWIHVDGAFGILGRLLTSPTYDYITQACAGLELADSITADGHKLLNVPYDCGIFLSRHREIASRVFQNPNAAYLASSSGSDGIMSPLNIGLENSRRFRALPVYASLVAYGKDGYRDMLERQIALSRGIADFLYDSDAFELLPDLNEPKEATISRVFIIVLFRAKNETLNKELVDKIKATKKIYVSGTSWEGKPACRFAVSNWMADVQRDLALVKQVLGGIVRS